MAADPYTALEAYADAVGKVNNARTHSILMAGAVGFIHCQRFQKMK